MLKSYLPMSCSAFLLITLTAVAGFTAATSDTRATGTLIVLNKAEATASLIDLATGEEIAKIETGAGPHEVAVSPDGSTAVVANYGAQQQPGSTLSVIDLAEQRVVKVIDLAAYHRPHGIVYMSDGKHVVVTAEQEQMVLVVDIEAGAVVKAISTAANVSHMVVLSRDETRAFIANIGSGSVSVVDLVSESRLTNVQTGQGAEAIDISPDGKEVWVGNRGANTVCIIDAESLEVVETIQCPDVPIRAKFTPDGSRVLVSNARSGDVVVFDAKTRKIIKRIPMAATAVEEKEGRLFSDQFGNSPVPVGILVHPSGKLAYVANTNADVITVIDLETLEIAGRLTAGKEPDGMGYSPLVLK